MPYEPYGPYVPSQNPMTEGEIARLFATLEEIKQALKVIYGENEEQDGLINSLGRSITRNLGSELNKINASLDKLTRIMTSIEDIQYKLTNLAKFDEKISKVAAMVSKIDLNNLEENIARIQSTLVTYDGKLTSIYRKL